MGISAYPLNSNAPSSLKLVAAASLPKATPPVVKPDAIPAKKLQPDTLQLSDADLLEISKLKARDTRLRQHEQAHHAASAGVDVSSASFTYQKGPNGVNYAVSGDVRIGTSAAGTPEDRLAQAAMIIDVALAPVDPTPTDRAVAAQARSVAQQASAEIMQQGVSAPPANVNQSQEKNSRLSISPAAKRIDTFA
jgi:SprA-related family